MRDTKKMKFHPFGPKQGGRLKNVGLIFFCILAFSAHTSIADSGKTFDGADMPAPAKPGDLKKTVSIHFEDVDINVFIRFISKASDKNFIVDRSVKGNVTIISPREISVEEAYRVFESVLEVHGFAAVDAGEITKIVPLQAARSKNIETRLRKESGRPEDKIVTHIVPLSYASPIEISALFKPLASKNSVILAYEPTNMLIITDISSNIKRLMKILDVVDVMSIGRELAVIPLEYADAENFVKMLNSVFMAVRQLRKGAPVRNVKFIADARTNAIVVMGGKGEIERIKKLIAILDVETPRGKGKIHVYALENASAEDMAKALDSLSSQKAPGPGKKKIIISGSVGIIADKATNSLIITADKADYLALENVIKKLDIPRTMVYIECLIMEVNVNKDFHIGAEWMATGTAKSEGINYTFGGALPGDDLKSLVAGKLPGGFSLGVVSEAIKLGDAAFSGIGALVKAYQQDEGINILSNPQILTMNNEEAKITVGKTMPFSTSSSITDGITTSSTEYKDVGITLKITPQISKNRVVRLKISQEVTRVQGTVIDNRPTTLKRAIETSVIVKDSNTVVIGGLIDDQIDKSENKVPCVGNIPLFGFLFKRKGEKSAKTNLFVFLTPHVIGKHGRATRISDDKKEYMESLRKGSIKMYDNKKNKK